MAKAKDKYIYKIGRRKTAHATVRLYEGSGDNIINDKKLEDVYQQEIMQKRFEEVFALADLKAQDFYFTAVAQGGGVNAQLESILLGLARAIVEEYPDKKKQLKQAGYLTRDPRMVERKKTGLRKARKAEQFSKR